MKYYRVTAYTPYCGEEMEDFIATEDQDELTSFADALCSDCAAEWAPDFEDWYEDQGYDSAEEYEEYYYSQCCVNIEEITEDEYKEEMKPKWPYELVKEGPGWDG